MYMLTFKEEKYLTFLYSNKHAKTFPKYLITPTYFYMATKLWTGMERKCWKPDVKILLT